jgi:hypothetical protein
LVNKGFFQPDKCRWWSTFHLYLHVGKFFWRNTHNLPFQGSYTTLCTRVGNDQSKHELYTLLNSWPSHTLPCTPTLRLFMNNIITTRMNYMHNPKQHKVEMNFS